MRATLDAAAARAVADLPGGGEERAGQREMAHAVAAALSSGRVLVARAGTGTGKSLAYLLPAALSGARTIVSTATKALQDQLVDKDLPLVARAVGGLSFTVLKGRANYLCAERIREVTELGEQQELVEEQPAGRRSARESEARRILEWAAGTETGDARELGFEPDPRTWATFSVGGDECPGASHCASGDRCFAERARRRAEESAVVVVNHHLLGADLAAGGAVLPEHDALVIDEAHEFEEVLTRSLGSSIGAGRVRAVAALGRSTGREAADAALAVADAATALERELATHAGKRVALGGTDGLSRTVELLAGRLEHLDATVRDAGGGAPEGRVLRARQALSRLREDVVSLRDPGDDRVVWVAFGARPSLEIAPIEVAPLLERAGFFDHAVVLTSATVDLALADRLGAADERTDVLDVASPFDYAEHAMLYCAAHLPDRRRESAEGALVEEIAALLAAAGGRALVLFTARQVMVRVADRVRERTELPILVQGELERSALLAELRGRPEVSVFATMGFWQGVDVPGAALSLVVIDRIPFPRPDDPLMQARRERAGPGAFSRVDLPRAASLLAQGAGRLIRSAGDRGVVAVLDPRLATASYRWELVRAMPPMRRTRQRRDAEEFLRAIDRAARADEGAPGQ